MTLVTGSPAVSEPSLAFDDVDGDLIRVELLHELFERQVDAQPRQIALICGECSFTYDQLDRAANRLARRLQALGVGPGALVGMLLPRSANVYVALLAILKSGAAYVPIDPDYPAERVSDILADSQAHALVTVSEMAARHAAFAGHVVRLDADRAGLDCESDERLPIADRAAHWRSLCYVIYTSGSTGHPKGVEIEHRSACHLIRAEGRLFQVQPDDRVFQGFSIAFDASVEEVWLAFFAGASLVVGTAEMIRSGPALAGTLTAAGVTVLSCVPTLLAMIEDDLPTVRLLILGGEVCPAPLVERWCRLGRRMVNTYGPTEATVIATWTDCDPAAPITIGRPLPNYEAWILDASMQPAAPGEPGELHLGGLGLARGYTRRPELTAEKFVEHQFPGDASPRRLYKTGDLARFALSGDIEFLGRIDSQVKLRGFRIELTEIESAILESPEVAAAVATVSPNAAGVDQLVAYVAPRSGRTIDEAELRGRLRARLPVYMVPAIIDVLEQLPLLPSGKLDRKRLPAPKARAANSFTQNAAQQPMSDCEAAIHAVWAELFAPLGVSLADDFFLDLGGHSLLAAQMVSRLRKDRRFEGVSMRDVYQHPTIAALAVQLSPAEAETTTHSAGVEAEGEELPWCPPSKLRYFVCGAAQAVTLYFVLGFFSLQWLGPYLTFTRMIDNDYSAPEAILGAFATLLGIYPLMLCLAVAAKWLVIGRYKAGDYPLWGWYYYRWWLVNSIVGSIPVNYLAGTPLLNWFFRAMGAKIGPNVHLASDDCSTFDLLSIGADTAIGVDASLTGCTVERGWLRIGPVSIGERCFVGTRAVVREHASLADGAKLEDLSMLPRGVRIPRGERWSGSPARRSAAAEADAPREFRRPSLARRALFGVAYAVGVLIFPVMVMAAIFPGMMLMNHLNYADDYYWYLSASPLVAASFVVLLCLEIALAKRLLLGRVVAGTYPLDSAFCLRKWFFDQLLELSLDVVGPLYATIYLAPWYRLLGAKLGRRAEISTASFISPDLLEIGEEGFVADSVSLGAARIEDGCATIAATRIGARSFVGNSALLPPGATVGDDCLIGCLSQPPSTAPGAEQPGTSWLGSPAFFLPV
ncbi:MAG TPA: amino acid adenylation domain-containing protein, partial [Pirellulales bacterium]|nr:amino acid adenylation domain-containing protein [Pirellulales bacterium]